MTGQGPIFFLASERSGTNLLRTLLSNHPAISGPVAAQLLPAFGPERKLYEPLSRRENALALLRDMITTANHPHFGWGLEVDAEELLEGVEPCDLPGLVDAVYRADMRSHGARRYACKENQLSKWADELAARFPDAQFLYLHRDPRDYAASWINLPILNHTPYQSACAWRDEQFEALKAVEQLGDRAWRLSYEQLIAEPQQTMTAVLDFLGEEPDPACFEVRRKKNTDVAWSTFWKNLEKPIMRDNSRKWERSLDADTIAMIETVAAEPMSLLGYAPTAAQPWRPGLLFRTRDRWRGRREDRRLKREHADTVAVIADRQKLLDGILAARRSAAPVSER